MSRVDALILAEIQLMVDDDGWSSSIGYCHKAIKHASHMGPPVQGFPCWQKCKTHATRIVRMVNLQDAVRC